MRAIVLLCEGKHDVAFLYRILKVMKFGNEIGRVIDDMPRPLNQYFKKQFEHHDYGSFNLNEVRPHFPQCIMRRDDLFVLMYGLGGNSAHEKGISVIEDFDLFLSQQVMFTKEEGREQIEQVSFVFFTDADDEGVEHQVEVLRQKYGDLLPGIESLGHLSILQSQNNFVGCYVFSDGHNKGKLEDLTVPLFRKDNEELFESIETFMETHINHIPTNKRRHKLKTQIGIAGQLQEPGLSNEVIIRQSTYITDDKIQGDTACREIMQFLEAVFDKVLSIA